MRRSIALLLSAALWVAAASAQTPPDTVKTLPRDPAFPMSRWAPALSPRGAVRPRTRSATPKTIVPR